ncbi:nucleotidyl transferase AbiEii/AbiGii toxin family protein [Thermodesulfovibrio hydrogeniphilus]
MQDLILQEKFELEVLDKLKSGRFLNYLIFTGGTMLRLCYELNRFSVDLDFWFFKKIEVEDFFYKLKNFLQHQYEIKDAENKYYTILFEIKAETYPRNLKIEIRKEIKNIQTEFAIAYSKYSNIQVLVRTPTLKEVMKNKIEAFLSRGEIRDVFDIEFLVKKGIEIDAEKEKLEKMVKMIKGLSRKDYSVKLGSIVEPEFRKYYVNENFKILLNKIYERLTKN